jgi:hypothetical protein
MRLLHKDSSVISIDVVTCDVADVPAANADEWQGLGVEEVNTVRVDGWKGFNHVTTTQFITALGNLFQLCWKNSIGLYLSYTELRHARLAQSDRASDSYVINTHQSI